ncbi:TonB-dependent receptor plug domain-containing protein [Sphingomonas cavernae]|uniref:TonB-dependent receptor plug domain-containing protein n=1 Tax=Sphingomonas cavernae TaxID=2320861 RepID=UPI001602583B|nr:TonB-dependent receptor plug domain-containing protein [Sphingomonas cavernae]
MKTEYRRQIRRSVMMACLCGAALAAPTRAPAQEAAADAATPPAEGKQIYNAADFARFAPKSALDMVREIPGFVIQASDDDRRGFGQASGNILIDGKRISGKSNDAEAALGRINARDVVQIEVVDGATLDVPGLSGQVANIITSVDGLSGNFRWSPEFRTRQTESRLLDGEIAVTGRSGALDYSFSLSNLSARLGNDGPEFALDGNGVLADLREESLTWYQDTPRAAATFKYVTPGGSIANLNLAYARYYFSAHEESLRSFPGTVDRRRDFYDREREWNYEVGGDYDFALGGGRFKLIGLRRFERSPQSQRVFLAYADGRPDTGTRFDRDTDEGESILRGEYRWRGGSADWQVSAEGAINTLDTVATLAELDASGAFQPVPLPGGTLEIEEKRGELALSYGRAIAAGLTLQSSIGGEYSRIIQSGAGGLTRTFYRPKGFVALAWKASPRLDISARIEREVGQLNFYDFAASVNVSGGTQNSANPDLRPPQSWNGEIELNRSLGAFGSLKARGYARLITDVVAQVPIGATGEAPGNLDSATVVGFDWNSTFNFDPLGWKGAKLDLDLSFKRSRLRDPLTGEKRPISEDLAHELIVNFRQDVPGTDWAWGAEFEHYRQTAGFRLDQHSRFLTAPGDLGVFVEHKDVGGLTLRAGVSNLLDSHERLYRTAHVGRRTGPIAFYEERSRGWGPIFAFTVRGSV